MKWDLVLIPDDEKLNASGSCLRTAARRLAWFLENKAASFFISSLRQLTIKSHNFRGLQLVFQKMITQWNEEEKKAHYHLKFKSA